MLTIFHSLPDAGQMVPQRIATALRFLLIAASFICSTPILQPCSCFRIGPACQAAWADDTVVFLGKAVKVPGPLERMVHGPFGIKRVGFHVIENFRGASGNTIVVVTGIGGGDCGFPFQEGHEYLVYAQVISSPETVMLSTSICSRTAPVERAGEDLAYLRSLAKGGPPSRVYGFVTRYTPLVGIDLRYADKAPHPIANVPIRLESEATSRRTVTDSEGYYKFDGLPAGNFTVSADMPLNLGGGERRAIVLRDHACLEYNLIAIERAQLRGRLLDDNQLPVGTTLVAMAPAPGSKPSEIISAYANRQGIFTIPRLPPGDFVLGVNISEPPREGPHLSQPFPPTYFPGVQNRADATVIHVRSAQQLSGFELRLPAPLKQRTIAGRITWQDGKPVVGAFVELKDSEFADGNVDLGITKRAGTFIVTGVQGRSYSLSGLIGIRAGEKPIHSETVQLKSGDDGPIRLVLSLPDRR